MGCAYATALIPPAGISAGVGRRVAPVDAELVDERNYSWESHDARYRVYHYEWSSDPEVGDEGTYSLGTYDLTGCDLLDAVRWVQDRLRPGDLYAVALVNDDPVDGRGLVWLTGDDVVYASERALEPRQREALARMRSRRGKHLVLPE